ncbi:P-loop containing nucleoside triphosphate hydrolase protein [Linderina pennispora]|uniref:p-loop containing nucleoside triphosphate hydrolase protein n=1 Tax=Linderina pennispora TaxID=61395 RepID=A0A1Y1W4S7_9FUNG|nr:P-loop containing nucleoside triphosphate hydrolase protein [Linderina pennispora]ORX68194.1 P-loop containing nucleoside triphosphate hydrolase protein [Linderina pennispora]
MPIISNLAGIRQLFINNVYPIQEVYDKAHMEAEAPAHVENSELTADWPEHGQVEFRNYSMRFTAKQDRALADVSLQIKSGERIGVVGRTGAGKTSLSLGLFRVIEAESGSILIDGVDIAQVGLHDLRSRLGIVSQDPALFHGTLRFNLDPLQRHCDRELWEAVEAGGIVEMVECSRGRHDPERGCCLGRFVECGGRNFSAGQRQLICLCRLLVSRRQVIVLDEATANIDSETDSLIRRVVQRDFRHSTVITIAHRLESVLDSDRIVVMDNGRVVELGPPKELASNHNGLFSQLLAAQKQREKHQQQ